MNKLRQLFRIEDRTAFLCGCVVFFKLLLFDFLWSLPTTFAVWSTAEFYVTKLLAVLLLLLPGKLLRWWWLEGILLFLLDALLIANLMYFRTYYTAIPLDSYGLSGNLADFMGSVYDSFRWADILFPLSSLFFLVRKIFFPGWGGKSRRKRSTRIQTLAENPRTKHSYLSMYGWLWGLSLSLFALCLQLRGGFYKAYDSIRQHAYRCTATTSMYTLAGNLYFDYLNSHREASPEVLHQIETWLSQHPEHQALADSIGVRNNCIVILAESLESWVLEREVEGQELTPCLNRLLKEPTTLYAPHVLTQVKGGRSIDAQLLLCAGMLPVNSGTYSSQFPDNAYFTLQKAMSGKKQARNYLLTIDKLNTWNQGVISRSFGTDTILSYHDFELTEAFGTHKRTGDGSFLRQSAEKIARGEIWKEGENAYMQFITYSGHAPFRLPEELKQVHFSDAIPQKMNDYMTTAHYTDSAIGAFVDFLKTLPRYKETLIVITGDHEGLATHRQALCESEGGRGIVSPEQFTPFIVLNSPVGMRYDKVMGQVDMYPTLLNLLQLDDYAWKGIGQSILSPLKKGFAVSPLLEIKGDSIGEAEAAYARQSFDISDLMIRFDYLSGLARQ